MVSFWRILRGARAVWSPSAGFRSVQHRCLQFYGQTINFIMGKQSADFWRTTYFICEVPRGETMLYSGTDTESYVTEYTSVYENKQSTPFISGKSLTCYISGKPPLSFISGKPLHSMHSRAVRGRDSRSRPPFRAKSRYRMGRSAGGTSRSTACPDTVREIGS